ncbi:MAG: nicotinate-nucleotide adenylyltransferase [Desulfuromonadaceae bacterium]|nr:nicotinate-nucleotide adenylyltransferase [Desulfuromonadaceae bacterium]
MRIGILGGSFNPVHNAHLQIAVEARQACTLERVLFVPAADPPHKTVAGNVPFAQRCRMVQLAIARTDAFVLSTIEGERCGKSYSIDTIRIFRSQYPGDELFFIIGGDSYLEIGTWHCYAEIFSLCNLIVVERPGCRIADPREALPAAVRELFVQGNSADRLTHESGTSVCFITGALLEISSTEIRQRAAAGADISTYVPPDVAAYISQQRIYRQCQ